MTRDSGLIFGATLDMYIHNYILYRYRI